MQNGLFRKVTGLDKVLPKKIWFLVRHREKKKSAFFGFCGSRNFSLFGFQELREVPLESVAVQKNRIPQFLQIRFLDFILF